VQLKMVRFQSLLVAFVLTCASAAAASPAFADEWPTEREFELVSPPAPLGFHPPPSSVVEDRDGSLLVAAYWPVLQATRGSQTEYSLTRLVRIGRDGSRSYVPPFGKLERGRASDLTPDKQIDDEILPLPDKSILFTSYNAVKRLRPDGKIVRFAGTGRYSESSSGDGGRAIRAKIETPHGLSRFPDGSIVFAERQRIRRVAPDGIITTIAGTGEYGYGGDGGPATKALISMQQDVLPTADGGFLIADTYNNRVRRVSPEGVISTIAGAAKTDPLTTPGEPFAGSGDGGPATAAELGLPAQLALLPDGSLLIGEFHDVRRVAPDGTISTFFDPREEHGDRLGDFAGRYGDYIEDLYVTREGGVAVMVSGHRLRALYLAPEKTTRTLVALRGTRVSGRRVEATVNATARGLLQLKLRRHGKLVAQASRRVHPGRSTIAVGGRFAAADHEVTVALRTARGGIYRDRIHVFTSETLPRRLVPVDPAGGDRCERIGKRRFDCEIHNEEAEEGGVPCLNTGTFRLFRSGLTFGRPYGPQCHPKPMPFDRTPDYTGPWRASPPR
jgi:hypothetical protein